jgi:uncharacterized protein (TIGR01777 family)
MKIVIAGGTGLIGSALAESFQVDGYEVSIISRDAKRVSSEFNSISWDATALYEGLSGSDVVINLAGASLAGENPLKMRWTKTRKHRIIDSRVESGEKLVQVISELNHKPKVFVQASAIGFYGNQGYTQADENSDPGSDFLANVCLKWEASTARIEELGIRRLVIRIGLVLSKSGGLLPLLALPFRLFVGGRIGSGDQYLSWIHIQDLVSSIRFLIDAPQLQGAYNITAPVPNTNQAFSKVLGKVLRRPAWLPIPAPILKIALGEAATLALDGRPVFPTKLIKAGFQFHYQDLEDSLHDLLNTNPNKTTKLQ